ncbi:MAG: TonB-dependent receptor [Saprospiraceae bacterium]|nr:TonB-dependent receptor [Saprospiraceae bacterium]
MKQVILCLMAFIYTHLVFSQNSVTFIIKDAHEKEGLIGATALIVGTGNGATTNEGGSAEIKNIPNGKQTFEFSYVGYEKQTKTFDFPNDNGKTIEILLEESEEGLEEVVVTTSRSSRTIANTPTRIEAISLEEIEEKSNMRPSNVSMLLHESTGIQVQQTSATSANSSIRIQGLDGRYTQLLKDGFANFGGFASGLSILDLPPLDLRQVEIIKGPASTLYGGGAIAGVVNFITKEPTNKREINLLLNQSNIGASDFGTFISGKSGKIGYTFLGTANYHKAYDVDKDDFTEVPKTLAFTFAPKIWFYVNDKNTLSVSNQTITQNRQGGDVNVIKSGVSSAHTFFETNKSIRNFTAIEFQSQFSETKRLIAKQSFSIFDRTIDIPNYRFGGIQYNAYTDVSFIQKYTKHALITGANVVYDRFNENKALSNQKRDFNLATVGIYAQDTWDATEKLAFENGLRVDYAGRFGVFVLPRISALYKWNSAWSTRLSTGLGYKTPTMFTEQTESLAYQNVQNVGDNLNAEKSVGGTFDINYKTNISDMIIAVNQMFFYTQINKPLILQENLNNAFFTNADKPVQSKGFETNVKFILDPFKFFIGFTYTDAKGKYLLDNQTLALIPKNKLNLTLMYEVHKNIKAGIEAYFTDNQRLSNGTNSPTFWEMGIIVEKTFGKASIYINAENLTDVRQSRFKNVNEGTHTVPKFSEIWTHTEGRVFSGGIKYKF